EPIMLAIEKLLRDNAQTTGEFRRIHVAPSSGGDIPDDRDTRLVILRPDQPYSRDGQNRAQHAVESMLQMRGNSPREYRNTLVFLAADSVRLPDLIRAVAFGMAWHSVIADKNTLNLTPQQVRQAEARLIESQQAIASQLHEVYSQLLIPSQTKTSPHIEWQTLTLKGTEALAVRVSRRMQKEELLTDSIAPTIVRRYMDEVPLWRGDAVSVRDLVNYFAQYLYLPRLTSPAVLIQALQIGSALKNPLESFGVADGWDEQHTRFTGLRITSPEQFSPDSRSLLVKPDVALAQIARDIPPVPPPVEPKPGETGPQPTPPGPGPVVPPPPPQATIYRRYFGSVELDANRAGRHVNDIISEIVEHLVSHQGARVR
ncbi:MAG: AAA+ family ATPase, partial [Roseiflexaceae bacterium]